MLELVGESLMRIRNLHGLKVSLHKVHFHYKEENVIYCGETWQDTTLSHQS